MKKVFILLLCLGSLKTYSQDKLTVTDSIKIAMYHAGNHMKMYEECMMATVCTEITGVGIIGVGIVAKNNNAEVKKTATIATTTYIGGALCLIGAMTAWIAPSYIRAAGFNLQGVGITWDIPYRKN